MILLKKLFYLSVCALGAFAIVATIVNVAFEFYFQDKIYPGVRVGNVDFGGQTESSVQKYFSLQHKNFHW